MTEREWKGLAQGLHELRMQELSDLEKRQPEYTLSEGFYRKLEGLAVQAERREKAWRLRRFIAAAACIALLLFNLARPQSIAEACRAVAEWFDDHVSFQFQQDIGEVYVPEYEMSYLPEGYEVVESGYGNGIGFAVCNGNLHFVYMVSDGQSNVNNEGVVYYELTTEDGTVLYCFESVEEGVLSSITWFSEDKTILFGLDGDLPMEELLKIQEGIVIKK